MIPNKSLIQPPLWSPYLPPDSEWDTLTNTTDVSLGGVGLSDPSQGLEYQDWSGFVTDVGLSTSSVYLTAPNTPDTFIFSEPGLTWMRFTFDQNMHPFICFVGSNRSGYFWWDPLLPGNTITAFPAGITVAACSMDDKRPLQTRLGNNDIIVGYVNNNNLCYRQQRDRYGTEYVLYDNINTLVSNPFVNKVGMDIKNRLQFQVAGQLYQ